MLLLPEDTPLPGTMGGDSQPVTGAELSEELGFDAGGLARCQAALVGGLRPFEAEQQPAGSQRASSEEFKPSATGSPRGPGRRGSA